MTYRTKFTAILLWAYFLTALVGCNEQNAPDSGSEKTGQDGEAGILPELVTITDETDDVLFSYGAGSIRQQARTIAEIPEKYRGSVHVTPLAQLKDKGISKQHFLVYDLRKPDGNGHYPGQILTRAEIEAQLVAKRKNAKIQSRDRQARNRSDVPVSEASPVIMYSTEWCGYCRKARAFLKRKKIPFIEKDIEKDKSAAQELAKKKAAAGQTGGGVPIFDVRGQLIQGFDKNTLLRLAKGSQ